MPLRSFLSLPSLPSLTAAKGMLRVDGLRLLRDRFLLGMIVYIVGIAIAIRLALPWVTDELRARVGFDLGPWYPLLTSHFVVGLAGLLAGILGGFLLLESREDRTIKALLVTPTPLASYLVVLGSAVLVMSTALALVQGVIVGVALPPWPALVGASVAAAPAALIFALVIAALADNKTEAFAIMKICAVAPLVPSGSYFLAEPWQWLAAVYPPYWAAKAYWVAQAGEGPWLPWVLGGLLVSAVWVGLLARLFVRAARR